MPSEYEFYPMPLFPRLTVSDVAESTEWYEALGFEVVYGTSVVAHVRYRKYADVMLADATAEPADAGLPSEGPPGVGVSIFLTVESESVDDVADRARSNGIDVGDGPRETPWNTRELRLVDPDGYELVLSEGPVDADASFDEVVGTADRE